jgi:peptidoglycan-associated lipoprotein
MAALNRKQKGDVMGLSHWKILLLALLVVGCESTAGLRGPSQFGRQAEGTPTLTMLSPTLTMLSPSILSSMDSNVKKPPRSAGANKIRFSPPDIGEANLLTDSRRVDLFPTVFFPFESWEINADVRNRLDATAQWMNQFPKYGIRIEGHTDVRGTESYNMVLGAKRAHAVKEYFAHLGIPTQRLETVSYGKVLVVCDIDDEWGCHQYNRRAELLIQ